MFSTSQMRMLVKQDLKHFKKMRRSFVKANEVTITIPRLGVKTQIPQKYLFLTRFR